jgi:hypothetical protein
MAFDKLKKTEKRIEQFSGCLPADHSEVHCYILCLCCALKAHDFHEEY